MTVNTLDRMMFDEAPNDGPSPGDSLLFDKYEAYQQADYVEPIESDADRSLAAASDKYVTATTIASHELGEDADRTDKSAPHEGDKPAEKATNEELDALDPDVAGEAPLSIMEPLPKTNAAALGEVAVGERPRTEALPDDGSRAETPPAGEVVDDGRQEDPAAPVVMTDDQKLGNGPVSTESVAGPEDDPASHELPKPGASGAAVSTPAEARGPDNNDESSQVQAKGTTGDEEDEKAQREQADGPAAFAAEIAEASTASAGDGKGGGDGHNESRRLEGGEEPRETSVQICERVATELHADQLLEGNLVAALMQEPNGDRQLVRDCFPEGVDLLTAEVAPEDAPKLLVAGNIADRASAQWLRYQIIDMEQALGDSARAASVVVGELHANNRSYVKEVAGDTRPRIVGFWELPHDAGYIVTQHTIGPATPEAYVQEAANLNPTDPDYDATVQGTHGKPRAGSESEEQGISSNVPYVNPGDAWEAAATIDIDAVLEKIDPEAFAAMQEFDRAADADATAREQTESDKHLKQAAEAGRGHAMMQLSSEKLGMIRNGSGFVEGGMVVIVALMKDRLPGAQGGNGGENS